MASKRQIKVDPASLGELTVSMLRGEDGFQRKEIGKMLDWLAGERPFDVVNLPYTLLLGLAAPLRRALGVPSAARCRARICSSTASASPIASSRWI